MQHDAGFFAAAAERALAALSRRSTGLAHRLDDVLARYDSVVATLNRPPDTLVHGSYRPQNVLVARSPEPRICPTDWELAAFGRSAFDLAYICDGFDQPRLDVLLDAYERELARAGLSAGDRDELEHEVECFRLHKTVNSLGHIAQWERPLETGEKVVASAERIAVALR